MNLLQAYKFAFRNSPYYLDDINEDVDKTADQLYYEKKDDLNEVVNEHEDSVVIFVHGWMESKESGLIKSNYIKQGLTKAGFKGQVIGLVWESDNTWSKSKKKAESVADYLATEIDKLNQEFNKDVNLISHSLGTKIAYEVIQEVDSFINTTVLMASPISTKAFKSFKENENFGRLYNFYNRFDEILMFGYPLYEFSLPIGLMKSKHPSEKIIDKHALVTNHASYYTKDAIYEDINGILNYSDDSK